MHAFGSSEQRIRYRLMAQLSCQLACTTDVFSTQHYSIFITKFASISHTFILMYLFMLRLENEGAGSFQVQS